MTLEPDAPAVPIRDHGLVRHPCLTLLVGSLPGQVFRLRPPAVTLGRGADNDVRLIDDGVSRQHARIHISEFGAEIEDLGSTNGTYLNGRQVRRATLAPGDKLRFGPVAIVRFDFQDALDEDFQRRQFEATTRDSLTACFNRYYFEEHLQRETSFSRRCGMPMSVAMIDVDHFKQVNDTFGHAAGDRVLVELARCLHAQVRTYDLVARLGGEEFGIILRTTGIPEAVIVAERIRAAVESMVVATGGESLMVTVSIGVASLGEPGTATPSELTALADTRLYKAKRGGRNCVISGGSISEGESTRPVASMARIPPATAAFILCDDARALTDVADAVSPASATTEKHPAST